MKRLIEKTVFAGLVTAWRFAAWPTSRSPLFVNATTEGVVRAPSEFSKTTGSPPSITAMQELVVPKSIPKTLAINFPFRSRDSIEPAPLACSEPRACADAQDADGKAITSKITNYATPEFETTRHSLPVMTSARRANAAHARNSKRQVPKPKEASKSKSRNKAARIFRFCGHLKVGASQVLWPLGFGASASRRHNACSFRCRAKFSAKSRSRSRPSLSLRALQSCVGRE